VPDSLMQETPDSSFATLDLAMALSRRTRAGWMPTFRAPRRHPALALSGRRGHGFPPSTISGSPGKNRSPFVGASVGMTIGIPVFTWGAIGLRVEQKALAGRSRTFVSTS